MNNTNQIGNNGSEGLDPFQGTTIPSGWRLRSILNICRNIVDYRGRTPKKLGMEWGGGDIPALSARNVKSGFIDFNEETYYGSEQLYNRWMANGHTAKDDIVFTTEAPLGNVALIPDNRRYIMSQRTILLQTHTDEIDNRYLFQFLGSDIFRNILVEKSSGSTATGIQRRVFEQLQIPLPPLPEQRAIAAALSDIDASIAALDALTAKKRDIKQATMQQLLTGRTRLPGFRGEWQETILSRVAELRPGINKPLGEMGSGFLYVTVQDLYEGNAISVHKLGRIRLRPEEVQTHALIPRDIVFGKSSVKREGIGYPSLFLGASEPAVCSGFSYRARVTRSLAEPKFIFYFLRFPKTRQWLVDNSQASALTNINYSIARSIPIRMPSVAEQTAIAEVLSDMDAEIAALETRRDKTRAIKQGMMQELLTGRTRLPIAGTTP